MPRHFRDFGLGIRQLMFSTPGLDGFQIVLQGIQDRLPFFEQLTVPSISGRIVIRHRAVCGEYGNEKGREEQ